MISTVLLFGETGTVLTYTIKHIHFQQGFKKKVIMRVVGLYEFYVETSYRKAAPEDGSLGNRYSFITKK